MKELENEIASVLYGQGACLVRFVDVTGLPAEQNRSLPNAVFFGLPLPPPYVRKVRETADYVQNLIAEGLTEQDEFYLTECKAGRLADQVADLLIEHGYRAYPQSDQNLIATGAWNEKESRTVLPHKTLAVMAGAGWIGKNNLFITPEYGPALCIGTILTNAPLDARPPLVIKTKCGTCKKCVDVCQTNALQGNNWENNIPREYIIDIHKCTTCLKCMVHCPYTLKYTKLHERDK